MSSRPVATPPAPTTAAAVAPPAPVATDRTLALTVYNADLALVKDVRTLELGEGRRTLRVTDVSAKIDPTSVHLVPEDEGELAVIEQNFQYDLVSADRILDRHRDLELTVIGADGTSTSGTLLSYDDDNLVLDRKPGLAILGREGVKEIRFPELPGGLITRPTLEWLVDNGGAARREAQLSYLTSGVTWHAEYVAVVAPEDDGVALAGWVSLENNSGTTYPDATLKLVAGDVHLVPRQMAFSLKQSMRRIATMEERQFEEQAFFEYHLYSLLRPTTLADRETKQLALFPTTPVRATKTYTYERKRDKTKVRVTLEMRNSEEDGLGIPLPKGTVRVFKAERSGSQEFVGEDRIGHTAKDEKVQVTVGYAFDIVAEHHLLKAVSPTKTEVDQVHEIRIRNRKESETITVRVVETSSENWRILSSSHDHVKKDASTFEFEVVVRPGEEQVLTYDIRFYE